MYNLKRNEPNKPCLEKKHGKIDLILFKICKAHNRTSPETLISLLTNVRRSCYSLRRLAVTKFLKTSTFSNFAEW